jgi:2-phospho-L-lactate guanylyltransferase
MTRIVVPFRGAEGKQRLTGLGRNVHRAVVLAMLADVIAAVIEVGNGVVVTADDDGLRLARKADAEVVDDPGGGQGAAVAAALSALPAGPALVVNADVPCLRPEDLSELLAAIPFEGIALVPSADGRTNALGLAQPRLFEPLYGPRSAERFARAARARGLDAVTVEIPNLVDDVDTLDDLERVRFRAGAHTRAALQGVRLAS